MRHPYAKLHHEATPSQRTSVRLWIYSVHMMDICVLIRGEIGNKAYQAWAIQVPKKIPGSTISQVFKPTCHYIVAAKATTEQSLLMWTKGTRPSSPTELLSPEWMISSLKSGQLLPAAEFRLTHLLVNERASRTSTEAAVCQSDQLCDEEAASYSLAHGSHTSSFQPATNNSRPPLTIDPSQPHDADETNKNAHITTTLDELQAMYLQMGDQFRAINYKKSSSFLKRLPRIDHVHQLDGIQGFGKSLKTTIEEIISTGSLRKLQHLKKNPRSTAITLLSNIWGVGEKTAEQLFNQGYHTIEDVRARGKHLLNKQQLVGLAHYSDFLTKIPRAEVDEIASIVTEECKSRIEPDAECTVCGSYRRGKTECGDVDILITPVEGREDLPPNTLSQLLEALSRRGFLTDHLSLPTGHREFVENSALEALHQMNRSQSLGRSRTGSVRGSVRSGTGSSSSNNTGSSQLRSPTSQSQSLTQSQSQFMSQSMSLGTPPGATFSTDFPFSPTQDSDRDSSGELEFGDDNDSDLGSVRDDEEGDEAGTQSETELGPGEPTKYDTYGGKKRKSEHRLYFGSRSSYMGVCRVPHPGSLHRRIDIKIYPRSQKAFALFYFTGSDAFNRGVRYYVARNGLALDDKGLMRCARDNAYKIVTRGELIPCATEHEIFDALGLAYREPWERPLFDRKSMILRPIQETRAGKGNRFLKGSGNTKNNVTTSSQAGSLFYSSQLEASQMSLLSSPGRDFSQDGGNIESNSVLGKRAHQE